MAEQQEALAALAAGLGDQVAGAFHPGRQVDPSRAEADGAQLLRESISDCAHAGRVLRRALDVHDALQEGLGGSLAVGGMARDAALDPVEIGMRRADAGNREQRGQPCEPLHHALHPYLSWRTRYPYCRDSDTGTSRRTCARLTGENLPWSRHVQFP